MMVGCIPMIVNDMIVYKNNDNKTTINYHVGEFYYGEKASGQKPPKLLNQEPIKCPECEKVLNGNIRFMLHMKHKLFQHLQRMETEMQNVCVHCHRKFEFPYQLEGHVEIVHCKNMITLNFTCRICNKWWAEKTPFLEHMKAIHVPCETPFRCKVCHFSTSIMSRLLTHFKLIHPATGNLMCHICCYVFKTVEGFTTHIRLHRVNRHHCTKCCLVFVNAMDLKKHQILDHKPGTINIIKKKIQRNLLEKSTVIIHPPSKTADKRSYEITGMSGEDCEGKHKVRFTHPAKYSRPIRARGRPSVNHFNHNNSFKDDRVDCKPLDADSESGLVCAISSTTSELSDSGAEDQNGVDEDDSAEDYSGDYKDEFNCESDVDHVSVSFMENMLSSDDSKETEEGLEIKVESTEDVQCNSRPMKSDQFTLKEKNDNETLFSEVQTRLAPKSDGSESSKWYDSSLFAKLHGTPCVGEPIAVKGLRCLQALAFSFTVAWDSPVYFCTYHKVLVSLVDDDEVLDERMINYPGAKAEISKRSPHTTYKVIVYAMENTILIAKSTPIFVKTLTTPICISSDEESYNFPTKGISPHCGYGSL